MWTEAACPDMNTNHTLGMTAHFVRDLVGAAVAASACSEIQRRQFLTASLPLPALGAVIVDEFHARNLALSPGSHTVWFITTGDPQSVFFIESSGSFGTCWGPDGTTGVYLDLGFRSRDPVEMFFV